MLRFCEVAQNIAGKMQQMNEFIVLGEFSVYNREEDM